LNNCTQTASTTRTMATAPITPTAQRFIRRIGTTTYRVRVHFNPNSKETMNEIIIRMIKNEITGKAAGE